MNEAEIGVLVRRVESLERRVRRGRRVSVALGALLAMVWADGSRDRGRRR